MDYWRLRHSEVTFEGEFVCWIFEALVDRPSGKREWVDISFDVWWAATDYYSSSVETIRIAV